MRTKNVTAPHRLRLLIPWIEGDPLAPAEVTERLARFLSACSRAWSDEAGGEYLGVEAEPSGAFTDRQTESLRRELLEILVQEAEPVPTPEPARSVRQLREGRATVGRLPDLRRLDLRYGVTRVRARPDKQPNGAAERRRVNGAGAFRMTVSGRLRAVTLYAFIRTLTEPGAVMLSRCPAPAPNDRESTCGRFVIGGQRIGRPPEYCSDACRVRAHRQRGD